MSKGFKKLLVFAAVIGAAFGAFYYFSQKRTEKELDEFDDFDEDDDFVEDLDEHTEDEQRSYVSLTPSEGMISNAASKISSFAEKAAEKFEDSAAKETIEEFFDEESDKETV